VSDCMIDIEGTLIKVVSWRFSNIEPYNDRPTPFGDAGEGRFWRFKCHIKGCGHTEFEGMGEARVECFNCQTEYIMGWS